MRTIVRFKLLNNLSIPTLDKLIPLLEGAGIEVLNCIVTKY